MSALLALAAVLALAALATQGPYRFRYPHLLEDQWALGEEVGRLLADGRSVYAVGCTHLLAFNHVDNYTMYGFFLRGLPEYLRDSNDGQPYRPLKDGRYPDVVMKSRKPIPDIDEWLASEYLARTPPPFQRQKVAIWRRAPRSDPP